MRKLYTKHDRQNLNNGTAFLGTDDKSVGIGLDGMVALRVVCAAPEGQTFQDGGGFVGYVMPHSHGKWVNVNNGGNTVTAGDPVGVFELTGNVVPMGRFHWNAEGVTLSGDGTYVDVYYEVLVEE